MGLRCWSDRKPSRWLSLAWILASLLGAGLGQAVAQPVAQDSAAEPSFDILEYEVQGNTVLDTVSIERAVYPHLGQGLRLQDVEEARKSLENAYRSAGFGLTTVDIPEQSVATGVIRLQVNEGRISRIRVTGARYYSQGFILERVAGAAEGQVPNLPSIQAQLLDVNRSPDRRVTPVFRPGREAGTTEVDLAVEDKLPLHGSVALNNAASRNTSSTRLQLALSYDNLFQQDHNIALQAVTSPEATKEVRVLSLAYTVPLGRAGLESLAFTATRSDSQVFAGLGTTQLFGKGSIFGLRRSYVLNLSESDFQQVTLGAEYKDMVDTVRQGEAGGFDTPLKFLPLTAAWTGAWRAPQRELQMAATLSGGVRGLVNRQQEFSDKRYQAQATYALLKLDVRHSQTLPWWGLRLRSQADVQLAPDPLVSNEQFVMGGAGNVRGYYEAEAVGDTGIHGSLQLESPDLAKSLGWKWLNSLSLRTFVDGAAAELRNPLPGQDWRFRLLGAGFGAQASSGGAFPANLSLDLGWPLLKRGTLGSDGLRVHMNASIGF